MKKFRLSAVLMIAALLMATVGSAALSGISFDRGVSAGQVLVDTDANVAVQFTNISTYTGLVQTGTDGKVSINLNQAISNSSSSGFNTDAAYTIGTAASGVIKIKNNSDIPVTVTLTNDAGNAGAITLTPVTTGSATITAGSSADYFFAINTDGQDAVKSLSAVLHVAG